MPALTVECTCGVDGEKPVIVTINGCPVRGAKPLVGFPEPNRLGAKNAV